MESQNEQQAISIISASYEVRCKHRSPLGKLQMQLVNAIQYPLSLLHNSDKPVYITHIIPVKHETVTSCLVHITDTNKTKTVGD